MTLTYVKNSSIIFSELHLKHPVIQWMFMHSGNNKHIMQHILKLRSRVQITINTQNTTQTLLEDM
jgi:hypothetical protein